MRIQTAPFFLNNPHDVSNVSAANVKRLGQYQTDHEFNEDWLQDLIHTHPSLLPAKELEPMLDNLIPVCRELPCPSGFLDNLYVTPDGYLVLAECKLWRNPESRRKVIAQIMDYAKDFAGWDYDDLMQAINKANKTNLENPLYNAVAAEADAIDEIAFVDQVSKNMRMGRHMLMIVGDGIQENMESLADHVQKHMGLHFTLALIEVGLFEFKNKGMMVIPSIIARTTNIERAIIRMEQPDAQITIEEPIDQSRNNKSATKSSLTEEAFFEKLSENTPNGVAWVQSLLPKLADLGITYDIKRTLILRFIPDGETVFNLGYIDTSGRFQTGNATWKPYDLGHIEKAYDYLRAITNMLNNATFVQNDKPTECYVAVDGRTLNINDMIGEEEKLITIIEDYTSVIKNELI